MPGLWKAWKAKSRLPTLPTSPLEISPKAREIPTFPNSGHKGGWKSGKPRAGFPLSHRPGFTLSRTKKQRGRASPSPALPRSLSGSLFRRPGGQLLLRPWHPAARRPFPPM